MALHNPLLEAAARLKYSLGHRWESLYFCRNWAADNQAQARQAIQAAAREVDFLRSIGALPEKGNDIPPSAFLPQSCDAQKLESSLRFLRETAQGLRGCKLEHIAREYDAAVQLITSLACVPVPAPMAE